MSSSSNRSWQLRSQCDGECSYRHTERNFSVHTDLNLVSESEETFDSVIDHDMITSQPRLQLRRLDGSSLSNTSRLDENMKETMFEFSPPHFVHTSNSHSTFITNENTIRYHQREGRMDNRQMITPSYGLDTEGSAMDRCSTTFHHQKHIQNSSLTLRLWRSMCATTYAIFKSLYILTAYALISDLWILSRVGPHVRNMLSKLWKPLLLLLLLFLIIPDTFFQNYSDWKYMKPKSNIMDISSYASLLNVTNSIGAVIATFYSSNQRDNARWSDKTMEGVQISLQDDSLQLLRHEKMQAKFVKSENEVNDLKESVMSLQRRIQFLEEENLAFKSRYIDWDSAKVENPTLEKKSLFAAIFELLESKEEEDMVMVSTIVLRLKRMFVGKEEFMSMFSTTVELKRMVEELKLYVEDNKKSYSVATNTFSDEAIVELIRKELALYDADKLGLADFALESSGGSVINTRCTETYTKHTSQMIILGIPLWHVASTPRMVIQPSRQPGECWAFKGSEGYIVIQLSYIIKPTAFSLEHIPKSISPSGTITSAPKDFSVWGLNNETDSGVLLGKYVYDENGPSLQTFPVQTDDVGNYSMVELKLHSNYGHPEFTCVYRFRVHGVMV